MSGTKFLLIQRWCYWTTEIELDLLKFWVELHIYLKPILSFPHRFPSFPSFSKNSQGQTSTNVELLTIKKETYKRIIKKEQVCNITQTRTNCPYATNCYMANNQGWGSGIFFHRSGSGSAEKKNPDPDPTPDPTWNRNEEKNIFIF